MVVFVGTGCFDDEAEVFAFEIRAGWINAENGGGELVDCKLFSIDGEELVVISVHVNKCMEIDMRDGDIGVSVGSGASGEDIGGLVLYTLLFFIGEVGCDLHCYISFINP